MPAVLLCVGIAVVVNRPVRDALEAVIDRDEVTWFVPVTVDVRRGRVGECECVFDSDMVMLSVAEAETSDDIDNWVLDIVRVTVAVTLGPLLVGVGVSVKLLVAVAASSEREAVVDCVSVTPSPDLLKVADGVLDSERISADGDIVSSVV